MTDLLDTPSPSPAPPADRPRQRRGAGRRSAHVARARRRARRSGRLRRLRRGLLMAVAAAVMTLFGWGLATLVGGDDRPPPDQGDVAVGPVDQAVLGLVRTAEPGGPAIGLTLLAAGADGTASATFVPSTTLVEIPGVGMDRLGLAQQYGGSDLTAATLENAIGIEIDGVIAIDQASLGALLQRIGGADVTLADRLVERAADGTGTVAFDAGEQFLNGVRLADYWAFEQRGESELDTFPRQQRAIDALLRALDPGTVTSVFAEVPGEASSAVEPAVVHDVLGTLADAAAEDVVTYQLLPVEPFGSADESDGASYQLREPEVQVMIAEHFAGAVPEGGNSGPLALQVLNGVGTPGIGQRVDDRLQGLGLRIVRSENARSFDFLETQIIIYDETSERLAAARQVQEALGVGTIRVSRQPQSVVDLTVVVGGDFIGRGPDVPAGL